MTLGINEVKSLKALYGLFCVFFFSVILAIMTEPENQSDKKKKVKDIGFGVLVLFTLFNAVMIYMF